MIVIGASLSGVTFALACANRGIQTCVLERGYGQNVSGSALGVDRTSLKRVVGIGFHGGRADPPFPVTTDYRNAVSWQSLHGWLRELALRRPEITLLEGILVCGVVDGLTQATAIAKDGHRSDATVIVGADGYRSGVRRAIDPKRPHAQYAGYLLWRGLVPEAAMPTGTAWPRGNDGVALVTDNGYRLVAYPVPNQQGSLQPGERLISFAWYDASREALLRESGCLSDSGHVLGSLGRDSVPSRIRTDLCALARRIWPEPWRGAIIHALEHRDVFATPVAEYFPHRLQRGRLAIIGDAAHVVSPKTGAGFVAGILDAEALADCLKQAFDRGEPDISSALKYYEDKRLEAAQTLVATSFEWSRAFLKVSSALRFDR